MDAFPTLVWRRVGLRYAADKPPRDPHGIFAPKPSVVDGEHTGRLWVPGMPAPSTTPSRASSSSVATLGFTVDGDGPGAMQLRGVDSRRPPVPSPQSVRRSSNAANSIFISSHHSHPPQSRNVHLHRRQQASLLFLGEEDCIVQLNCPRSTAVISDGSAAAASARPSCARCHCVCAHHSGYFDSCFASFLTSPILQLISLASAPLCLPRPSRVRIAPLRYFCIQPVFATFGCLHSLPSPVANRRPISQNGQFDDGRRWTGWPNG